MLATVGSGYLWVIEDTEGGGYVKEGLDGWELTHDVYQATTFDNEPEAVLTAHSSFPTLSLRVVKREIGRSR